MNFNSDNDGYLDSIDLESEFDLPSTFDPVPLMETPPSVNHGRQPYQALAINPMPNMFQGSFWNASDDFRFWNEALNEIRDVQNNQLLLGLGNEGGVVQDSPVLQQAEQENNVSADLNDKGKAAMQIDDEDYNQYFNKNLSRKEISKYFYLPIAQAAKQLNVGLTLLKKRCREIGIPRWPHRKLRSLQTLIKNVQELNQLGGQGYEEKLKDAVKVLENEKKMLVETPNMELEAKTKKLRQACFKANYKKKKLINVNKRIHLNLCEPSNPRSVNPSSQCAGFMLMEGNGGNFGDDRGEAEQYCQFNTQCAVSDCLSSTESGF